MTYRERINLAMRNDDRQAFETAVGELMQDIAFRLSDVLNCHGRDFYSVVLAVMEIQAEAIRANLTKEELDAVEHIKGKTTAVSVSPLMDPRRRGGADHE